MQDNKTLTNESPRKVGPTSEESSMDVRRTLDKKSDDDGATDGVAGAMALQSARELRSDGGRDVMAMALWSVRELYDDGKRQRDERCTVA
jgi:hypothetical protein